MIEMVRPGMSDVFMSKSKAMRMGPDPLDDGRQVAIHQAIGTRALSACVAIDLPKLGALLRCVARCWETAQYGAWDSANRNNKSRSHSPMLSTVPNTAAVSNTSSIHIYIYKYTST